MLSVWDGVNNAENWLQLTRRLGPRTGNRDQPRDNFYRPEESAQEVDTWDNTIASSTADQGKDGGKTLFFLFVVRLIICTFPSRQLISSLSY